MPSAPNTDPILADQIGGKETSGTFERKVRQTVSLLVRFSLLQRHPKQSRPNPREPGTIKKAADVTQTAKLKNHRQPLEICCSIIWGQEANTQFALTKMLNKTKQLFSFGIISKPDLPSKRRPHKQTAL